MCGIHASVSKLENVRHSTELQRLLCERGPDHLGCSEATFPVNASEHAYLTFTSTVLSLRGGHITAQPFADPDTGSVLCWNGEAWSICGEAIEGNDGEKVFQLLLEASRAASDRSMAIGKVFSAISSICGPFGFVYFDRVHSLLYFGRDRLGRRSLLFNLDADSQAVRFSSIAEPSKKGWAEVEADGLYLLSCMDEEIVFENVKKASFMSSPDYRVYQYTWTATGSPPESSTCAFGALNREIPVGNHGLNLKSGSVDELELQLKNSMKVRVLDIPRPPAAESADSATVAVLFSGGLDCTVLARVAHDILPSNQQIDLLNVAFENPRVLKAAQNASDNILKRARGSNSNHGPMIATTDSSASANLPNEDLVSCYEGCPDRITGRKAFHELQRVCKGRTWRFVEINIPYSETVSHRAQIISLIHPHNTEMDLSIGYALYFAARGSGLALTTAGGQGTPYSTTARVLLSGLGADELFGGYTRHANAFKRHSYEGLIAELELDVNRLGKRNLGRDDRVISHWGREARFPYLDENFVSWALSCPVWEKCDFGASPTSDEAAEMEPGKKVLRLLAYRLSLVSVAHEKKRAIQFGARTAKMETGRTKGTSLIS